MFGRDPLALIGFLAAEPCPCHRCSNSPAVRRLAAARAGSLFMLVQRGPRLAGTIGGGALEYMVIDHARRLLRATARAAERMDVPLGPEIGQCCGGRVDVDAARSSTAVSPPRCAGDWRRRRARGPHVSRVRRRPCRPGAGAALSLAAAAPGHVIDTRRGRTGDGCRRASTTRPLADAGGRGRRSGARQQCFVDPHPRPCARFPDRGRGADARATPPMSAWSARPTKRAQFRQLVRAPRAATRCAADLPIAAGAARSAVIAPGPRGLGDKRAGGRSRHWRRRKLSVQHWRERETASGKRAGPDARRGHQSGAARLDARY